MKLKIGAHSIEIGAAGDNGVMGSSLTALTPFDRESVHLSLPEPEANPLYDEQSDDPFAILLDKPGDVKSIEFTSSNLTVANLILAMQGEENVDSGWNAPVTFSLFNKSVRIKTMAVDGERFVINIPKAIITGKIDNDLNRKEGIKISFVVKVLSPRDASDNPLVPVYINPETISGKVATPVISQATNTVTVTCATGSATIKYTITGLDPLVYGSTYSTPFAITEDVLVRVIATKTAMDNSNYAQKVCEYAS